MFCGQRPFLLFLAFLQEKFLAILRDSGGLQQRRLERTKARRHYESFAKGLKESVNAESVPAGIPPAVPWDDLAAKKYGNSKITDSVLRLDGISPYRLLSAFCFPNFSFLKRGAFNESRRTSTTDYRILRQNH